MTAAFKQSWYKHPIIWNVCLILISLVIFFQLLIWFMAWWTHHGQNAVVPDVIGMDYQRAVNTLQAADLKVVIADSVYRKDKTPGSVVDVIPQPNATVKAGREVFVTIVAFAPEPITIDAMLTDMSYKQAEAILKAKGLRVEKRYVPYQYNDIVVDVKCKGRSLSIGSRITVDDVITLEVGQVPQPVYTEPDPLDMAIDAAIDSDPASTPATGTSTASTEKPEKFGFQ